MSTNQLLLTADDDEDVCYRYSCNFFFQPFDLFTFGLVYILSCRNFDLSPLCPVNVLTCRRFDSKAEELGNFGDVILLHGH